MMCNNDINDIDDKIVEKIDSIYETYYEMDLWLFFLLFYFYKFKI